MAKKLVLYMFIMIYKRKDLSDDPVCYRVIGILNHAYKIPSIYLLKWIVTETSGSLSD